MFIFCKTDGNVIKFNENGTFLYSIKKSLEKDLNSYIAEKVAKEVITEYNFKDTSSVVLVTAERTDNVVEVDLASHTVKNAIIDDYMPLVREGHVVNEELDKEAKENYAKNFISFGKSENKKNFVVDNSGTISDVKIEKNYASNIASGILSYYLSNDKILCFEEEFKKRFIPDHLFEIYDERTSMTFFYCDNLPDAFDFTPFDITRNEIEEMLEKYFKYIPKMIDEAVFYIMEYLRGTPLADIKKRIMDNMESA